MCMLLNYFYKFIVYLYYIFMIWFTSKTSYSSSLTNRAEPPFYLVYITSYNEPSHNEPSYNEPSWLDIQPYFQRTINQMPEPLSNGRYVYNLVE